MTVPKKDGRGALSIRAHAALSDTGRRREENQDAWHADPEACLFLVTDGMGGMNAGGTAARAVAELFPKLLARKLSALARPNEKALKAALQETVAEFSAELRERARADARLKGMGATLVLALARGPRLYLASLGDSRIYLLERGRLRRLSKDHSIVAVMLALGKITPEAAASHPLRHNLSRYVGMDGKAAADVQALRLKAGGRLLLCSDGLTNGLPDEAIQAALRQSAGPEEACRRLVAEANAAGGDDNITALVVDLAPGA
jgi:protein phosphatase